MLYALGVGLLDIQQVLGHKGINETLLYTASSQGSKDRAAVSLGALFK